MKTLFVRLTLATIISTMGLTVAMADKPDQATVPLKFTSKLEGMELPPSMLRRTVTLLVNDGRSEEGMVIGSRTKDDESSPIKTGDDITQFVTDAIAKMNSKWMIRTDGAPDFTLRITVTRFHLSETLKKVGSWYNGEIKLKWQLSNPDGKVVAEDTSEGNAHRYGRSASENRDEVLSDALVDAYQNILTNDGLQTAWKGSR